MFEWLFGKKSSENFEEEVKKSFSSVKGDIGAVGKWLKHLDSADKQLFDVVGELKEELSTIRDEVESLREAVGLVGMGVQDKQLLENGGVLDKQTAVQGVQEPVQTAVQTGNLYDIFKGLSQNERVVMFTLINSEMKLSYEDLAMLLGKERSTIRGQINSIRQKSENLIEEMIEKNGKKRVFIRDEIKDKLAKYVKVRAKKKGKRAEKDALED